MRERVSFSPCDAGTPEQSWQSLFSHCDEWHPHPGSLLVVAPHPDDEVLGAGGLLRFWAMTGQSLAMLSVTDGEAADRTRANLAALRHAELSDALKSLSASQARRESLHIPDGRVQHFKDRLRIALEQFASKDATIIAPFELDGHPDHEAVGQVCLDFARSARLAIARYPVWTWHHTRPEELQGTRWGLFPLGAAALRAKIEALGCFESQLRPPRGTPILPPHVLCHFMRSYEAFVL